MHISHAIAVLAIAQVVLANPHNLATRAEEGTRCDELHNCKYSYTTGSGQCSSGFERTNLEVAGFPLGSYCERTCTASERASCIAANCKSYEQQCNLYPQSGSLCATAIEWCAGPIAMLKGTCTSQSTAESVTYDQAKHLCIPKGKTATSRQALPLRLGPGANLLAAIYDPLLPIRYRQLRCFDVSYATVKFVAQQAANATSGCTTVQDDDQGDTGYDFLSIKCQTSALKFSDVETLLFHACVEAQPFGTRGPFFNSLGFSGSPK